MKRLPAYWSAGVPGVVLTTPEEERVLADLTARTWQRIGGEAPVWVWSCTEGLRPAKGGDARPNTKDPVAALAAVRAEYPGWSSRDGGLVVWRDLGAFPLSGPGANPILGRSLRDTLAQAKSAGAMHIFIGPRFEAPLECTRLLKSLDFDLPDRAEMEALLTRTEESAREGGFQLPTLENGTRENVLRGLAGLTIWEAEDALAVSIAETATVSPEVVFREKVATLRSGALGVEIAKPLPGGLDSVAGLDLLKAWLLKRKAAWSPKARAAGVRPPKGVLALGPPGTGKTLTARAVATAYGLLYVRLDMGRIYGSLVGQTEQNLRAALKTIEALAPCVLHIDEVEKAFAGFGGGGGGDSGVSRRAGGKLLEWMQDQESAFVVCTANDIDGIPPEFLRAGRLDAIFGLDLPNGKEREAILRLKLTERGQEDPGGLNYSAARMQGYTGAEIEAVVQEALLAAYAANRTLKTADLTTAADEVKPQSVAMKDRIEAIRAWTRERGKPASSMTLEPTQDRRITA